MKSELNRLIARSINLEHPGNILGGDFVEEIGQPYIGAPKTLCRGKRYRPVLMSLFAKSYRKAKPKEIVQENRNISGAGAFLYRETDLGRPSPLDVKGKINPVREMASMDPTTLRHGFQSRDSTPIILDDFMGEQL